MKELVVERHFVSSTVVESYIFIEGDIYTDVMIV